MRYPIRAGNPFNLLPESARTRALQKRVHRYLVRAAAVVVLLMVGLTGLRFFQVHGAESHLSAVQAENATIRNVQIPKYDKALVLRDKVLKQSGQVVPTLDKEVDWLVVLNQLGQYIPANVTLSTLTLEATSNPGTTGTTPTAPGAIGTISTSLDAQALTDVTAWGHSIARSPIFKDADLTGGVNNNPVSFSATLDILDGAKSQRVAQYSVPG